MMIIYELRPVTIHELHMVVVDYIESIDESSAIHSVKPLLLSDLLRLKEECEIFYAIDTMQSVMFKTDNEYLSLYCDMIDNYLSTQTNPNPELVLLLDTLTRSMDIDEGEIETEDDDQTPVYENNQIKRKEDSNDIRPYKSLGEIVYVDFSNGRRFSSKAELNRSKINIVKI